MKKKLLIVFIIVLSFFITGCGKDNNSKISGSSKENKHITDFLLNNIIDISGVNQNNQFYVFNKDGKFIYSNSTKIRFKQAKVILFIKGTWTLKENTLVLKQEEMVYQSYDSTTKEYKPEYTTVDEVIEYKDLKLDKLDDGDQYLNGDKCSIRKKTNNNKDFVKEVKYYLEHDLNNVDLEKLKKIEAE